MQRPGGRRERGSLNTDSRSGGRERGEEEGGVGSRGRTEACWVPFGKSEFRLRNSIAASGWKRS